MLVSIPGLHHYNNNIDTMSKYPFNEGDDYYTIEDGQIVWSCWDNISEELFDQNPNKKYYSTKSEAQLINSLYESNN